MAFSGAQKTRLALNGTTRGRYGSFAGKAAALDTGDKYEGFIANVGRMMNG